jgi:hypothetical protein
MNRIIQIAIGTTIGILAAILIVAGTGAAWRAYQAAETRAARAEIDAAQARQDAVDRAEAERTQKADWYQECKAWIGTSNRPLERICQIITDVTQFNSTGEKAASYKQCVVDAKACRDFMAEHDRG